MYLIYSVCSENLIVFLLHKLPYLSFDPNYRAYKLMPQEHTECTYEHVHIYIYTYIHTNIYVSMFKYNYKCINLSVQDSDHHISHDRQGQTLKKK